MRLKKWKKIFKIYTIKKVNNLNDKIIIKDSLKYKIYIYFIFLNKKTKYLKEIKKQKLICYKNYSIFLERQRIIFIINDFFSNNNPLNKFEKFLQIKKNISYRSEIYYLFFLEKINNIDKIYLFYNINYVYKIKTKFELILWIHFVKLNYNIKDEKYLFFNLIKEHQNNCKDINYYYNELIFNNNLGNIIVMLRDLLLNYKFII